MTSQSSSRLRLYINSIKKGHSSYRSLFVIHMEAYLTRVAIFALALGDADSSAWAAPDHYEQQHRREESMRTFITGVAPTSSPRNVTSLLLFRAVILHQLSNTCIRCNHVLIMIDATIKLHWTLTHITGLLSRAHVFLCFSICAIITFLREISVNPLQA